MMACAQASKWNLSEENRRKLLDMVIQIATSQWFNWQTFESDVSEHARRFELDQTRDDFEAESLRLYRERLEQETAK